MLGVMRLINQMEPPAAKSYELSSSSLTVPSEAPRVKIVGILQEVTGVLPIIV